MIVFSGVATFVLLKLVGLVIPLRAADEELEIGDHAIHGHEVYPADVASLGSFGSVPLQPTPPLSRRRRRPEDVSGRGPQQRALRVRGHERAVPRFTPTRSPERLSRARLDETGSRRQSAGHISRRQVGPLLSRFFRGASARGAPEVVWAAIVGRRDGGLASAGSAGGLERSCGHPVGPGRLDEHAAAGASTPARPRGHPGRPPSGADPLARRSRDRRAGASRRPSARWRSAARRSRWTAGTP